MSWAVLCSESVETPQLISSTKVVLCAEALTALDVSQCWWSFNLDCALRMINRIGLLSRLLILLFHLLLWLVRFLW